MYLRNVKPLKFTAKAAAPPTASPKGFEEHMFFTYVFSEGFRLLEGTGCNLGTQVPPKALLFIFWGRGIGSSFFSFSYFLALSQGFSFLFLDTLKELAWFL